MWVPLPAALTANWQTARRSDAITRDLFGNAGIVLLGLIFLLACLNTCIGLISCCSEYFSQILPRFSQRQWAFFFAFVSMVISNAGLSAILAVSVPVLGMIYPPALVLILLSFWTAPGNGSWFTRWQSPLPASPASLWYWQPAAL